MKENDNARRWLQASVNTDDLGVFDTSLENEFVLLAAALRKQEDGNKKRLFTDEEINRYLEDLRQNGFSQCFEYTEG